MARSPANPVYSFLKNGSSIVGAVDGSITAVQFEYALPDPADQLDAMELILYARFVGPIVTTANGFGDLATLTNGLLIQVLDANDAVVLDVLAGEPLQALNHVNRYITVKSRLNGSDTDAFRVSFELSGGVSRCGTPLRLNGRAGHRLVITVQDNLSTLDDLNFLVHGNLNPLG